MSDDEWMSAWRDIPGEASKRLSQTDVRADSRQSQPDASMDLFWAFDNLKCLYLWRIDNLKCFEWDALNVHQKRWKKKSENIKMDRRKGEGLKKKENALTAPLSYTLV